jgi:hypothetical protein
MANETENQIVVYQPNETVRLDVRLENETVWLTQSQMGELFGCTTRNVRLHLENIYACGELLPEATRKDFFLVRIEGARQVRRTVTCYNLDAIISVGYRVNSILGVKFRQWATSVLKEYLLRGYAVNSRFNQLEDKIDRRFAKYDTDIAELKDKVDFFVQTQTPPLQGVFYEGQLWDACSLVEKLIGRAKKTILLIDSWVGTGTLDMLAKKRKGVVVEVVTSPRGNKLVASDIAKFNAQYGGLSVKTSMAFHDRFLIIDDKELYLIGASLKDLGKKCFGFTALDKSNIPDILAKI